MTNQLTIKCPDLGEISAIKPCRVCGLPLRTNHPLALAHPECKSRDNSRRQRDKKRVTCITCGIPKLPASFYKNSSKKNGLQSECRVCMQARARARTGVGSKWNASVLGQEPGIDWRDANYNPLG